MEKSVSPRDDPFLLRQRGRPGELLDQGPGELGLAVVAAADLTDIDRRDGFGVADQVRTFEHLEQTTDPRVRRLLVVQPGQKRHLVAAILGSPSRHIGLLVPAQKR